MRSGGALRLRHDATLFRAPALVPADATPRGARPGVGAGAGTVLLVADPGARDPTWRRTRDGRRAATSIGGAKQRVADTRRSTAAAPRHSRRLRTPRGALTP
jgi:hypothetical protein